MIIIWYWNFHFDNDKIQKMQDIEKRKFIELR